jgi:asparagine synthetase B (glutamine-hydrolysing)
MSFAVWVGCAAAPDPRVVKSWHRSIAAFEGTTVAILHDDATAAWLWSVGTGPAACAAPDGGGRAGRLIADALVGAALGRIDVPVAATTSGSWVWVASDASVIQLRRDVLGRSLLFRSRVRNGWLIASREAWLLAHPEVSSRVDEDALVAWLAEVPPPAGHSIFGEIKALGPGESSSWDRSGWRSRDRVVRVPVAWRGKSAEEASAMIEPILLGAVERAFSGARRPALLLSAGVDSSLVAAAAARCGIRPVAITHGPSGPEGPDERVEAERFARRLGLEVVSFDLQALAPYRARAPRTSLPDHPWNLVYRELRDAIYGWCHAEGVDRLVDGNFGDELHAQPLDALADDLIGTMGSALAPTGAQTARWAWRALRRRLSQMRGRPRGLPIGLSWLRPQWRNVVRERFVEEQRAVRAFLRPEQAQFVHGTAAELMTARERLFGQRFCVDYRPAFHDPALIDVMLSLPARFSWRNAQDKWIFRSIGARTLEDDLWWREKQPTPQAVFRESAAALRAELEGERKRSGDWLLKYLVDEDPADRDEALLRAFLEVETYRWLRQVGTA